SRNGTWLRDRSLPSHEDHSLIPGDTLRFGRCALLVTGPLWVDPAWLRAADGTVERLARVLGEARDYPALPVLADALVDAGCANEEWPRLLRDPQTKAFADWLLARLLAAVGVERQTDL